MIWPMIVGAGVGVFIIFMIWLTNQFLKRKIRKVPVIELPKQSLSEDSSKTEGKKKKKHRHKHKKG